MPTSAPPELSRDDAAAVAALAEDYRRLRAEIGKVIIGQEDVVEELLTGLFARGHVLLIGVPGLAKTLLVSTVARISSLSFRRIQFTPDMMPSDITGTDILQDDPETGRRRFTFIGLQVRLVGRRPPRRAIVDPGRQGPHCAPRPVPRWRGRHPARRQALLRHRIVTTFHAEAEGIDPDTIICRPPRLPRTRRRPARRGELRWIDQGDPDSFRRMASISWRSRSFSVSANRARSSARCRAASASCRRAASASIARSRGLSRRRPVTGS